MSRYKGNAEECPHGCGLRYRDLRTGMTYTEIFTMLKDNSTDPKDWTYKRRGTVLGKWFEIKQSMWTYHCDEGGCPMDPRNVMAAARQEMNDADPVPF